MIPHRFAGDLGGVPPIPPCGPSAISHRFAGDLGGVPPIPPALVVLVIWWAGGAGDLMGWWCW